MEEIQIDITITMGETCSNTMSLAEARELYKSLGDLFTLPMVTGSTNSVKTNKVKASTIKENVSVKKVKEEDENINDNKQDDLPSGVNLPPPNPKVEAARERAARRTRGCGSR